MIDENMNCDKALVMFSGGFDSVAVVLKLIESGDYATIDLVFNNNAIFLDDQDKAHTVYLKLRKMAELKGIIITWFVVDSQTPMYINGDVNERILRGRDMALTTHLTTLWHIPAYTGVYLGWNGANIHTLKTASTLLSAYKEMVKDVVGVYFIEDVFMDKDTLAIYEEFYGYGDIERLTKKRAIETVLEYDLFAYCQTGSEDYDDLNDSWYNKSGKWKEVLFALIDLDFDAHELTGVLESKNLEEIQRIWHQKKNGEKAQDMMVKNATK